MATGKKCLVAGDPVPFRAAALPMASPHAMLRKRKGGRRFSDQDLVQQAVDLAVEHGVALDHLAVGLSLGLENRLRGHDTLPRIAGLLGEVEVQAR